MSNAAANPKRALPLDKWPPRLVVSQVATILGCSHNHVIDLIDSGALPALDAARAGSKTRSFRVTREALAAFLQKRKAT